MAFTNQFDTTGGGVPGMGDAFITTPISGIDPIAQIIQNGAQRRQEREKQRQEQLKQQEDIFKGINLGSDKYWVDKDAEYFHGPQGAVPKLLEEVKKAYIAGKGKLNPLDYAKFQQSISKLQADAAQSLKDRDVYTKSIEAFRNPKSNYDVDKSLELANGFAGAPLGQRDVNNLTGAAKQIDPIQHLNKNFGPAILKNIAPYVKVFDDKDQQAKAQEQIDGTYAAWKPGMISSLVAQGMEPDEALKAVEDYGATIRGNAGYTPKTANQKAYQDKTIDLKGRALDITALKNKNQDEVARARLKVYQDNSELQKIKTNFTGDSTDPTGVTTWAYDLNKGDEKAIQRLNTFQLPSINTNDKGQPNIATSNKDAKIILGSSIPQEDIKEMGLVVNPNKQYITMSFSDDVAEHNGVGTKKVYIEMDDKNMDLSSIVNSPLGKVYNEQVIKKQNTPYTNPEYAAEKHRSSGSTTTTYVKKDVSNKPQNKPSYKFTRTYNGVQYGRNSEKENWTKIK